MPEFKLDFPDEAPCLNCNEEVELSLNNCPSCLKEMPYRIHAGRLMIGFVIGKFIDVRQGGLVLGVTDPIDTIPMFHAVRPGILEFSGRMMGNEFVVNQAAAAIHGERLVEINTFKDAGVTSLREIPLSSGTRIFNTFNPGDPDEDMSVLTQTGQFVVNPAATAKHFAELVEINNSIAPILFDSVQTS